MRKNLIKRPLTEPQPSLKPATMVMRADERTCYKTRNGPLLWLVVTSVLLFSPQHKPQSALTFQPRTKHCCPKLASGEIWAGPARPPQTSIYSTRPRKTRKKLGHLQKKRKPNTMPGRGGGGGSFSYTFWCTPNAASAASRARTETSSPGLAPCQRHRGQCEEKRLLAARKTLVRGSRHVPYVTGPGRLGCTSAGFSRFSCRGSRHFPVTGSLLQTRMNLLGANESVVLNARTRAD